MSVTQIAGRIGWTLAVAAVLVIAAAAGPIDRPNVKGKPMSYGESRDFLARHTRVVELSEGEARVAVCPEWQGRVMTSSCGGLSARSFGFINRPFIEAGELNAQFNNYGAEERMWLSPEGGRFSLWFKPGVQQTLDHWYTSPALNEGPFDVIATPSQTTCRMARRMRLKNASGTEFDLEAVRDVRLLDRDDLATIFGPKAAGIITAAGAQRVAYETVNTITNRGRAMTRDRGLVSIWMLGMLNSGPNTVIVVPYRPGDESELGPPVKSDYFGPIPPDRLEVAPQAILFRADAEYRSKIGTSQRRARNVLGSIDFDAGVLTLVAFSMPEEPAKHAYMNNIWGADAPDPYVGDVANAYNDGPPAPGKPQLGKFYEIESLSPAQELKTGQSLVHRHRTIHVQAKPAALAALAREVLGVELDEVRKVGVR